jgi:ribosome-binding ATPase YchF (GTP1/OBG family)
VGVAETRAWDLRLGSTASQAAGKIHSDIEKGFIRADVIAYDDFIALGSEAAVRAANKVRSEGKDYVVHDADIMLFRFK